ncbi:MAG: tetratricopeptide repeat protein [Woeseiaceae bacterium]
MKNALKILLFPWLLATAPGVDAQQTDTEATADGQADTGAPPADDAAAGGTSESEPTPLPKTSLEESQPIPLPKTSLKEEETLPAGQQPEDTDDASSLVTTPDLEPENRSVPVAEDDLEADVLAEAAAAKAQDPDQRLADEFEQFKQLIENRSYDEADTVAKRIIELAIATKGPKSHETAKALTNLAIVQERTKQFEAAQQNFQAAIDIIEDIEDRLNSQLVNPLKGLAAAELESGRPDLASDTYQRAIHVTHVNQGPHNLNQIDLLESLAEVDLRMGDVDAARDVQDRIYALNVRAYDVDTMELIPSLMRRAAWQQRAGLIYDERATYRRVIHIIEVKRSKDDLALVEPLVLLGKSFFYYDTSGQPTSYQDAAMSTGEIYFKRAVRIAAESPDSNWRIVADTTLALGDNYMHDGNVQRARQVYASVWNMLSEDDDPDKLEVRRDALESVHLLKAGLVPGYVGESDPNANPPSTDDPVRQGRVVVSYVVSTRGRATRLKLVEAEPPEFSDMQTNVEREVRRRLYRPRFDNADAVDSKKQLFEHTFYYRQSDLDALKVESPTPDQQETT